MKAPPRHTGLDLLRHAARAVAVLTTVRDAIPQVADTLEDAARFGREAGDLLDRGAKLLRRTRAKRVVVTRER